jgi:hypothetical protein
VSPKVKSANDRRQWRGERRAATKASGNSERRAARSQRCDRRILAARSIKASAASDGGLLARTICILMFSIATRVANFNDIVQDLHRPLKNCPAIHRMT